MNAEGERSKSLVTIEDLETICKNFLECIVRHEALTIKLSTFTITQLQSPGSPEEQAQAKEKSHQALQHEFVEMRRAYTKDLMIYKQSVRHNKEKAMKFATLDVNFFDEYKHLLV